MTNLEVGDIVLCTVDKIVGTVVFVKLDDGTEASIILSEIAPGRIRNLRDYVVPKKRIVCKVLRVSKDRVDLSLRRVTAKEKKEILEQENQGKSYKSILKTILGERAEKVIEEISKENGISEFLQEAKKDSKKLEKLVGKKYSEKILEILKSQKQKKFVVKKEIHIKIIKPNGLELIKRILDTKEAEIRYISGGKYSIKKESKDLKSADSKLKEILFNIEKEAKKHNAEVSIK